MAYVNVPKDVTKVKPKVFMGLTKRQIICFGGGACVGVPLFFLLKTVMASSAAALIMVVAMMPFFLFAMVEVNGEPFEQVIHHFVESRFKRPRVRPYQTNNAYAALERQAQVCEEVKSVTRGKRKLSKREKEYIRGIVEKARGDGKTISAQQTIPFKRMFPDGICRVTDNYYTKTIQYQDITYQLAQREDKEAIFSGWSEFLNGFDSSICVQFSFFNLSIGEDAVVESVSILLQNDEFNPIREEFTQMLHNQLARGNNGQQKSKYLTFGIESDDIKNAKTRLERIETDLLLGFKKLGVQARSLDGKERLALLHSICHMDTQEPFRFEWDWLPQSGLSAQDFIAPGSFDFRDGRSFRMGSKYCTASLLQILAPEMSDRSLKEFLDVENSQIVTMHIRAIDQSKAIKQIKHTITELDRTKIEEQKRAVKAGYDMDILPSDLATYGKDAKDLLQSLQSRNERMFLVTFVIVTTGDTRRQLKNNLFRVRSIAQAMNCSLVNLDFQQENAFVSSLPLGINKLNIHRGLTTSSTAIFVPFTTQELFQHSPEALYYGTNALSNNLIMVDRKKINNPNGLILGTSGSGKSFAAKRELTNVFLSTTDDTMICDPEGEYAPLVKRLHGQIIKLAPTSSDFVNPLDINLNYSEDENPLALKSDFVLSFCELVMGGKESLQPIEKTVIDRAVRNIYRPFLANPLPENMPILGDLYNELLRQPEHEAARVAAALELYVSGSLNVFNHRTNVDVNNRIVCYDIKDLGKQLKKLGMLIVQDQVWNRVTANRQAQKSTRFYIDEFHLLLREEQTATYSVEIWKRFRKWGGIPTGITQNVKDLLASKEIENILENSDFILMLNQAAGDRQILAKHLGISEYQLSYVTQAAPGEGLLFYGNTILPFVDHFPKDSELYKIMTTKLEEVQALPVSDTKTDTQTS